MSKFLYPIYKLKTKSYIKWWLYHKKAGGSGILSEILEGFSFNLENTLNRKFKLFEIEGNSVQDGSPSPDNEVPILSSGDNGSINEKIKNANGTEEQNYSIPVQQPMRSIGDVRDCFVKENGNWFERHYVLRLRILSNMSIESYNLGVNSYLINIENDCKYITDKIVSISNYFKGCSYDDRGTAGNHIIYPINNGHSLVLRNTEFSTLAELKAFFDNNEVYVDYILENPTDLPCTETQIQQLENKPSTYKEMTIINSEDETPAHLKIQYYKEG